MAITVLPNEVIDQIAAGEVVERPSHLVKELVENSLDAGAKKVVIEFAEGGRSIKVTDDGIGIQKDEIPKALERFATSKISAADDLWKLSTYGFRGEALASISAVSRLSLISRTEKTPKAFRLVSEFGKKNDLDEVGGPVGTQVVVEDLFANVPARLKFMKSAAAEHGQIKQTLKALALCHPQTEFQIFEEQELKDIWPGVPSRLERAKQILGIKKLYFCEKDRESFHVEAAFASPHDVAKTSKNIWLFVQDRWVQDRALQAAVMDAYRNLLMHGEYPFAAIWVQVPPDQIDVNIHPTKSQVKFADPSMAFRSVHSCLREGLEKAPWLAEVSSSAAKSSKPVWTETKSFERPMTVTDNEASNLQFRGRGFDEVQYAQKSLDTEKLSALAESRRDYQLPGENGGSVETISRPAPTNKEPGPWSRLQVLAQAHLTYLVCQSDDKLVFVDQHAAHERVYFERLMESWQKGNLEVQEYLFPLAIDLTAAQIEVLQQREEDLKKLGITIETLGPQTLGVKSAPAIVKESALNEALNKMADDLLDRGGSFALEKMMADLCARLACHSAVRAGQSLSHEQMRSLLAEMDEYPLSSFCPHGRPVSVDYPFYKLEKDFGRIV